MTNQSAGLCQLMDDHEGVLSTSDMLRFITQSQLRWQISTGRWQKPARGVVVAQPGPLTDRQLLRVALLRTGPQAALAGLTAARRDGFTGFNDKTATFGRTIYLLAPYGYKSHTPFPGQTVVTHYSQALTSLDVHPQRQPRRTRIARPSSTRPRGCQPDGGRWRFSRQASNNAWSVRKT